MKNGIKVALKVRPSVVINQTKQPKMILRWHFFTIFQSNQATQVNVKVALICIFQSNQATQVGIKVALHIFQSDKATKVILRWLLLTFFI